MDFADVPLQQTYVTGIYKKPSPEKSTFKIYLMPFHDYVWAAIAATLIVVTVVYTATKFMHQTERDMLNGFNKCQAVFFSFFLSFEYTLGGITAESLPETKRVTHASQRFLMGAFWIFGVLLVTLWKGEIISYLSVTLEIIPIQTLDDMVNQNAYTYGVLGGTLTYDSLRTSNRSEEQLIWRRMVEFNKKDDIILSADHHAKIERVKKGGYIYIEEYEIFAQLVSRHCDLVLMEENLYPLTYSIGLPHNSAFKPAMNKISLKLIESGIMKKLFREYFLSNTTCARERASSGHGPVLLAQTSFVFYLFAVAVCVSIGVLIAESTIWRYGQMRERYGVRGLVRGATDMFGRLVPK